MSNLYSIDKNIEFNLEKVKWSEVNDEVFKINPELAEKCDYVSKYRECALFKIQYSYGEYIVKKGVFQLPTQDGKLIPINDAKVPEFLKENLIYGCIPLSLVLNNSTEVFVKIQNRVAPRNFLVAGELFGLFELMSLLTQIPSSDTLIWNVSAGARSTFMIPSIFDTIGHNRIKKRIGADIHVPSSLSDHWKTFVDINKYSHNANWNNTILVFSKEWFEDQNDLGYINFYKYLVSQCWKQFQLLEDFTDFSLLWSFFTHAINKRNLKPRPYLVDTIKHLISIAKGFGIAFQPSTDDIALPMSLIQQTYINDYNLKDYIPNIMQPAKITKNSKVYYSLSFPTLSDSSPYFKNPPSIIENQREIKKLLDILINTIYQIENSNVNLLKNIKFKLFHSGNDPYGQILSSKIIPEGDPRFLNYNSKENRIFCSSASFFNGCIAISRNN
ncbi:MAG: hypothetical protein RCG15_05255 [Candidatus Rickettsia vulgarisii]